MRLRCGWCAVNVRVECVIGVTGMRLNYEWREIMVYMGCVKSALNV